VFSENFPLLLTGAFLTSLCLSLGGTYAVRGWAIRHGYVDHPDEGRRIHTTATPNVGGIAVAIATLLAFVVWGLFIIPDVGSRPEIISMLLGGAMMFALGFWDDTHPIRARTKFGLQILIASLVFAGGVRIMGVGFGGVWYSQLTAVMALVVTVIWIVGTTNAFNLIDGSDGVAGGAATFASISMGIVFALHGDPLGALMATVLVGACLGFLFFNFPPATVFMGDCGSLFLGFTLATLGVITTQKSSTLIAVTIPVIAFGIPLLDTLIAIVRRYLRHEPIFSPDRGHIHHRLSDLGMSSRRVALFLYVACAGAASLSLVLAAPGRNTVLPVFVVAGAVLILVVQRLNVPELVELSRVVGRGFQQRAVISHNVRVHVLSGAFESARSGAEVVDALRDAFEGSEFSAIELWIDSVHGQVFEGVDVAEPDDGGFKVRIVFERVLHPEQEYEIRVPMLFSGDRLGRMSFLRPSSGPRLYTDIRLVAQLLVPIVTETLERLAQGEDRSESQAHS
jgi:UDP-GlcNAc:undecaprenyl-phosphate/decaprenyl-phosphate GlcNAc-1-phosphate transferase